MLYTELEFRCYIKCGEVNNWLAIDLFLFTNTLNHHSSYNFATLKNISFGKNNR